VSAKGLTWQWICFSLLSCYSGKKRWGRILPYYHTENNGWGSRVNSVVRFVVVGRGNVNCWREARIYIFSVRRNIGVGRHLDRRWRKVNFGNDVFGWKIFGGWFDLLWGDVENIFFSGSGLEVFSSAGMSVREGTSAGVVAETSGRTEERLNVLPHLFARGRY